MSEIKTPTTSTPATTKAKKPQTTFTAKVVDGAGATLTVIARLKADKTAEVYVVHSVKGKDGKPTNTRGATSQHATLDAAKAAQAKAVAKAVSVGWIQREMKRGFAPTPDAFTLDTLPKPTKKKAA